MSEYDRLVEALSAGILATLEAQDVEAEAVALTPEQEALLAGWPTEYPDDDEPVFPDDDYQPTADERQAALDDDHDLLF